MDNQRSRSTVFDCLNQVKQSLFINIIIIFDKVRIKTSFNGWSCNMAWILHTRELYFHSPAVHENTVLPTRVISSHITLPPMGVSINKVWGG